MISGRSSTSCTESFPSAWLPLILCALSLAFVCTHRFVYSPVDICIHIWIFTCWCCRCRRTLLTGEKLYTVNIGKADVGDSVAAAVVHLFFYLITLNCLSCNSLQREAKQNRYTTPACACRNVGYECILLRICTFCVFSHACFVVLSCVCLCGYRRLYMYVGVCVFSCVPSLALCRGSANTFCRCIRTIVSTELIQSAPNLTSGLSLHLSRQFAQGRLMFLLKEVCL